MRNFIETAIGAFPLNKIEARAEERRWRAECDMRTLMEAEEIKRDPKRLAAAQEMAREKLVEMGAVAAATGLPPAAKKS